jgi:hypothetical protein
MKSTDIPVKIPLPWATNDASVVAPTPLNPTGPGRGSWTLGFTSLNMLPLASGGVPPFGQDMNGVLQAISAWGWWAAAGGQVRYDNVFSTENGGYPLGAYLQSADHLGWWMSLVDDNATDPDSGGSNWGFVPFEQSYNGDPNTHVAGNAASAGKPPNTVWDYKNSVFWICTTTGNAAGAVWVPLSILIPVNPSVTGASNNYVAADLGSLRVRSNGGTVMSDTLPTVGSVGNGWWVPIFNKDGVGILTLTAPGSTKLNGVTAGSVAIGPGKSTLVTADANGDFWVVVPPLPQNFAPQEVYINASGNYGPGAYIVDTTGGPVVFTFASAPTLGDNYSIRDMFGTFAANNVIINPNGKTILNQSGNLPINVNWVRAMFAFKSDDWSQV